MTTIQKQSIPVVMDEKGDPVAIVFYNTNRDRIVYVVEKAGEDDLIELLGNKKHEQKNNDDEGTGGQGA
jgi:hypothetical protein